MDTMERRLMTRAEAEEWKRRIGDTAHQLRLLLFEGYERCVWNALGHTSWTHCLKALAEEFRFSERRLWQIHAANQIEQQLTEPGSVGQIPEKHLRPLGRVKPEHRQQVWQKARDTAPQGQMTAEHVERVVNLVTPPTPQQDVLGDTGRTRWHHELGRDRLYRYIDELPLAEQNAVFVKLLTWLLQASADNPAMVEELHQVRALYFADLVFPELEEADIPEATIEATHLPARKHDAQSSPLPKR